MNEDRFAGRFDSFLFENGDQPPQEGLHGFTTNPLSDFVTPTQLLMYQAAYQQAQKDLQEPEWPDAECWN